MNNTSRGCEVGQQCREIAGALDHRARGGAEPDAHLARDDLRQGRLAEPRRPENSTWSSASPRALAAAMKTPQIVAQLALADELGERQRPQRGLGGIVLGRVRGR